MFPIKVSERTQAAWCRQTFLLYLTFKPLSQSRFTAAAFHCVPLGMNLSKHHQQTPPTTYALQVQPLGARDDVAHEEGFHPHSFRFYFLSKYLLIF